MHKVVVFVPCQGNLLGKKTFETKNEEEHIEMINTDQGCLLVKVDAQLPKYTPSILAVFKDWLYWERLEP